MAQYKKKRAGGRPRSKKAMQAELKQDLIGIALLALGLFVAFCLWQVPAGGEENILGALGFRVYKLTAALFGSGKWFLALALVVIGAGRWFGGIGFNSLLVTAYIVLALSCCAVGHLFLPQAEQNFQAGLSGAGGGLIGGVMVQGSNYLIGVTGSWILYIALIAASLLLITGKTMRQMMSDAGDKASAIAQSAQESFSSLAARSQERRSQGGRGVLHSLNLPTDTELREDKNTGRRGRKGPDQSSAAGGPGGTAAPAGPALNPVQALANREIEYKIMGQTPEELAEEEASDREAAAPAAGASPATVTAAKGGTGFNPNPEGAIPFRGPGKPDSAESADKLPPEAAEKEARAGMAPPKAGAGPEYKKPPMDILALSSRIKSQRLNKDITDNVRILEETLASFGVKAVVTQVNRGPSITRFELQPAPGVKVSRIVNLSDDLALAMAAAHIRIEAPIPGKPYVGVEIPNPKRRGISIRTILESPAYQENENDLPLPMGVRVDSRPLVIGLEELPHLLVAGTTGSGKSVFVTSCITGLCTHRTPEELRLILIDPKRVELSIYENLPHMLAKPVVSPKKAVQALAWAVREMEHRYEVFARARVRNLKSYNQAVLPKAQLPHIVIVVDELADLMFTAQKDVEDYICRLAQMARATGIHLILATQRPSVNVITGLIKANVPARVAFTLPSQTDSRTIIDVSGAERLLGKGDMLFVSSKYPRPLRLQSPFIDDGKNLEIIAYLRNVFGDPEYVDIEEQGSDQSSGGDTAYTDDPLLKEALADKQKSERDKSTLLQMVSDIAFSAVTQASIRGLVLFGGDPAVAIAERLGAQGIEIKGQVEPYIPHGELIGGVSPGLPVVTKAGGFGKEDFLAVLFKNFRKDENYD